MLRSDSDVISCIVMQSNNDDDYDDFICMPTRIPSGLSRTVDLCVLSDFGALPICTYSALIPVSVIIPCCILKLLVSNL